MNVLLNVDWGFTMAVVLTGIVVVFAALILLVFIIWLFGKIMTSVGRASSAPKAEKKKEGKPEVPVVEIASDGLTDDVVAAITAAVSAILAEEGDGKSYVVKSIKRVRKNRFAWGKAAAVENTRPF